MRPRKKIKKYAQVVAEEQLHKRLATNKRRGTAMEKKVASVLKGKRVPFSGAGELKGDGIVNRDFGMILVECKTSAAFSNRGKLISFSYNWITKLEEEVKAMRAKFGVVVIHFYRKGYFALVEKSLITRYLKEVDFKSVKVYNWEIERVSRIYLDELESLPAEGSFEVTIHGRIFYWLRLDFLAKLLDDHETVRQANGG